MQHLNCKKNFASMVYCRRVAFQTMETDLHLRTGHLRLELESEGNMTEGERCALRCVVREQQRFRGWGRVGEEDRGVHTVSRSVDQRLPGHVSRNSARSCKTATQPELSAGNMRDV